MSRRPSTPALKDALVELKREQRQRERVFPRWVAEGRLKQDDADWRMACLDKAIDEISERIEAAETTGRLL
jgi:hypothetical protein